MLHYNGHIFVSSTEPPGILPWTPTEALPLDNTRGPAVGLWAPKPTGGPFMSPWRLQRRSFWYYPPAERCAPMFSHFEKCSDVTGCPRPRTNASYACAFYRRCLINIAYLYVQVGLRCPLSLSSCSIYIKGIPASYDIAGGVQVFYFWKCRISYRLFTISCQNLNKNISHMLYWIG